MRPAADSSPADRAPADAGRTEDGRDLRRVARWQRRLIGCFAVYALLIFVIAASTGSPFPVRGLGGVALYALGLVILVIGIAGLLRALGQSSETIVLWSSILLIVPFIAPFLALAIHMQAGAAIRKAGLPHAGWLGVSDDEVVRCLHRPLCRGCGYDLTGNVSGRCPECGRDVSGGR
jgi:hypothetical protein